MQMFDVARTDVEKNHRILVFGVVQTFGQQVVYRFVVGYRDEIGGLYIVFGIHNGVAKR